MTKAGFTNGSAKAAVDSGDVWYELSYSTSRSFAFGWDESASLLKLNTAAAGTVNPSTGTNLMTITAGGAITKPLQPAFFSYQAANVTNATGDSTYYNFGTTAMTEKYDQGSNITTGGVFTAPVTGVMHFGAASVVQDLTSAMTDIEIQFLASTVVYNPQSVNAYGAQTPIFAQIGFTISTQVLMAAGDTAIARVGVFGGVSATATVTGGSAPTTYFYGALIC